MQRHIASISLTVMVLGSGCAFAIRDADRYQRETDEVLASKDAAIKTCYDKELARDAHATGELTLNFEVDRRTGVLSQVEVMEGGTTVSPILAGCVVGEVAGLRLAPRDLRDGNAVYTWRFQHSGS